MIIIKSLGPGNKGEEVIYSFADGMKSESGKISSWNDRYIFVRFSSGGTAAACDPRDLHFSHHR